MNHSLVMILSFSIIVPAIIGIFRFRKLNQIYFPFLLCIWIGLLNEFISVLLIDLFHVSNSVNTDIYCLMEALLYTWLFKNLNLFTSSKHYKLLLSFLCTAWLIDNFIISQITLFDSYFTIVYSLMIVLMSITILNRLIVQQINLLANSTFLICAALIVYFTLMALMEIFWLYGLNSSSIFRLNIYRIMSYINLSVNLIFAIAILWMHRKQEFTLQQ
ncbi:MAG TPA: hypothetical protein VIM07_14455 [Chitinophagaceae bacterium]